MLEWFWQKVVLYDLEVIIHLIKICVFIMLTFLKSFYRLCLKQKYIAEKDDFEILRWPYLTNDPKGHTLFYEKFASS